MRSTRRQALLLGLGQLAMTITLGSCVTTTNPSNSNPPTPASSGAPAAAASPVRGAAPLPQGAPTVVGPPPTVVGASTPAPSPAANASGAFSVEGAASPVAAASPSAQAIGAVASPSPAAGATVTIATDRRFDPNVASIGRGQSVRWQNTSRNPQTVTCDPGRVSDPTRVLLPPGAEPFDSGVINPNSTFSHTFTVPGEYQYVSLPFESSMIGQVQVS
jgi:plastocyanin